MKALARYVVVSPVKDEEPFVRRTLESVANQTVLPVIWVLVDDGSTDGTKEILEEFAREHAWVRLVIRDPGALRQAGSRVIQNFQVGCELLLNERFDFIVKLDCDLELPLNYFEQLLQRFECNPKLGIASGIYLEQREAEWVPVPMPEYHAAGALKMVRRTCFDAIGGFVASRGWDTVDEIKAQVLGWATTHFADLRVLHLKDEGSGVGFLQMSRMSGEIHFLTGGGPAFFLAKFIHRLFLGRPVVFGSLAMLIGYVECIVTGRKVLVDAHEARYYRRLLNRRIIDVLIRGRFRAIGGRRARYS